MCVPSQLLSGMVACVCTQVWDTSGFDCYDPYRELQLDMADVTGLCACVR